MRLDALHGLYRAVFASGDPKRALKIAESLIADPHAGFDDWMAYATARVRLKPELFESSLADLSRRAGNNPATLSSVAAWVCDAGHPGRIETWVTENSYLKAHRVSAETLRIQLMLVQKQWTGMIALLEESQGDAEYAEILWDAAAKNPRNLRWTLGSLFNYYQVRRDSKQLLRVSQAALRKHPEAELHSRDISLYYALALAAAGQPDKAGEIAGGIDQKALFPEETALLEEAGLVKQPLGIGLRQHVLQHPADRFQRVHGEHAALCLGAF